MAFPLSTYRLQMRADCFTFADAMDVLDYLADLGVSHLYLSPILTAVEGSTHGYDVTDPGTVSAALGGPEGAPAPPGYPADDRHYRLTGWRHGVCGYRRFFSITSLAGLRQEDRAVFDATHVEVRRWFAEGLVDGLRIDHPDGLSNPAGYLAWLREAVGPDAWIVIEKILAVDEPLEASLPVAGTTGYDALREIGGLFIDPAGAGPLTALVESSGFAYDAIPEVAHRLKAEAVTNTLCSELARLHLAIVAATRVTIPTC